jgi:putative hydrolase of the HAD superfamily
MRIKYILFDAANTLIHKPMLWERMQGVLVAAGHNVPSDLLRRNHKLMSECLHFPDRTSQEFYQKFNAELLYSLGIIPTKTLLTDIFRACTYLPWAVFTDTRILTTLRQPLGIVSNFNKTLPQLVGNLFGSEVFRDIVVSELKGVAKPQLAFYEAALAAANVPASEILYVGDSIKLDMEPALTLGMQAVLIDRDSTFLYYPRRIDSFAQLSNLLAE